MYLENVVLIVDVGFIHGLLQASHDFSCVSILLWEALLCAGLCDGGCDKGQRRKDVQCLELPLLPQIEKVVAAVYWNGL